MSATRQHEVGIPTKRFKVAKLLIKPETKVGIIGTETHKPLLRKSIGIGEVLRYFGVTRILNNRTSVIGPALIQQSELKQSSS